MKENRIGLVHIYCGDGKGKTTAGMGLCARAAGCGRRVLIYQFMKDNSTGEREILRLSDRITIVDGLEKETFSFLMTPEEKVRHREYYAAQFRAVTRRAREESFDVLFLDEAVYAIRSGLLDETLLLDFLHSKPDHLEVILTGQDPSQALLDAADYVSDIRKVKHPFDQGIPARRGIER